MPRDMHNLKLSVGDRVLVPCVVNAVGSGHFVNLWVETEAPIVVASGVKSRIALNGRQCYREPRGPRRRVADPDAPAARIIAGIICGDLEALGCRLALDADELIEKAISAALRTGATVGAED
jgi:hypothetical protein